MIDIIFDQYQRYKNAQIIINSIRENKETFKILEVGANEHKNLEKFLPKDDVTYLDINLPDELLNDPKYILGDATDMEFEDVAYDIVVALDVYEHIPVDRREHFVNELNRVCKNIAIISAPFNKEEVVFAEKRANTYYKSIIGLDHHWLYEHIDNGLPSLEELEKYLTKKNIRFTQFAHGNLGVWEKLTNAQALIQLDDKLGEYVSEIDKYYNEFVFFDDYDDNGYRQFIILEKSRKVSVVNRNLDDKIKNLDELLDNLYRLFDIKVSLGLVKPELIVSGDNIVRVYVDYGNGYSEADSLYRHVKLSNINRIILDEFKECEICSIRIDPTEKEGKFIFRDLIVKNNEVIEDVNITSNSIVREDDMYTFTNMDPQIIVNFDSSMIKSVEFTIQKIEDYNGNEQLLQGTLLKLLTEIKQMELANAELITVSTEGIIKKIKKRLKRN